MQDFDTFAIWLPLPLISVIHFNSTYLYTTPLSRTVLRSSYAVRGLLDETPKLDNGVSGNLHYGRDAICVTSGSCAT